MSPVPGVMIIDDSAVTRQIISEMVQSDPELRLIGSASDPLFALEKMKREWPDVIVLDIEMPRMNGLAFLEKISMERPTPVIICSVLVEYQASITLQALALGAVDFIIKPRIGLKGYLNESTAMILDAIKAAAKAKMDAVVPGPFQKINQNNKYSKSSPCLPEKIVAIGASTGGTNAIEFILTSLPDIGPCIVIVQHMPEKFTQAFAERLNQKSRMIVKEASHLDQVVPGTALIAPGNRHMRLKKGLRYYVEVADGPTVSRHRPSVNVLFNSVAECTDSALGIILTGMGDDGSEGLLRMKKFGAKTVAQDEKSSVVFGMPAEAIRIGAVDRILNISSIPDAIMEFAAN